MDAWADHPDAFPVYLERLVEPYSGMPLLGVGGYVAWLAGLTVEVFYDDAVAATLTPTPTDDGRAHFATQLPVEADTQTVRVVAVTPTDRRTLATAAMASIGDRAPTGVAAERGMRAKLFGLVRRTVYSLVSGEIVGPRRWLARADRFSEFLLRGKQRLRARWFARSFRPRSTHDAYVANTALTPTVRAELARQAKAFRARPKFSILMPVFNVEPRWFFAAVESVRSQVYANWELCIADDASTRPDLKRALAKLPRDARIKLVRRVENGHICACTNSAADLATGDFVAFMDHDDLLAPDALLEVARRLQSEPDADVLYSDEDKTDAANRRYDPQFKPDWSPELLLSYNYVNHLTVMRRSLFERVGRFRAGTEGSQDHDLLLRATERTDRVQHIAKILYHWRALPESTATAASVKPYVRDAGRKAVEDAMKRRGLVATLSVPAFAQRLRLPILQLESPKSPTVAVIVYGAAALAARTLQSLKRASADATYTTYLVVDPAQTADALNRIAAARSEEIFVFLKAGIEASEPAWLGRLTAYLAIPGVGAVGGLVRDEAGRVVSAGTMCGMRDGIAPAAAFAGLPAESISYYFYAEVARNVSAPGDGCFALKKSTFERAGGFDADRFARSHFDVELGLRFAGMGLRCVHVAGAEFVLRSDVPQRAEIPTELLALKRGYGRYADPYSNANCSDRASFAPRGDSPHALPEQSGPLRALVAAHNLNSPEGAPRYLSEIILGLAARKRLKPCIVSPLGGAGESAYREVGMPVTLLDEPWGRRFVDGRWSPREYEAARRRLRAVLRTERPQVVVANTLLTFPWVEAAASLGIPSVWIIHESYAADHLARLFPPNVRARVEAAFRTASRVVPASHDTAALFADWNSRANVRVLHNGLDVADFPAVPVSRTEPVRFVAVGTICERKGQHTLVEAAAMLARTRTDFAIDIVGLREAIPYGEYVRALVRRRGVGRLVNLVPETDRVRDYLRGAHAFVCTSHMETFSRAILEAEAFGLPILSTPCCGIAEQVFWGANALAFPCGDAAALAERMGQLLADPALRTAMAKQSRAAFELHLNRDEMLDRYDEVIRQAARDGAWQAARSTAALPARRAA